MEKKIILSLIDNPNQSKKELWEKFPEVHKSVITSSRNMFLKTLSIIKGKDLTLLYNFLDLFDIFLGERFKSKLSELDNLEFKLNHSMEEMKEFHSNIEKCESAAEQIFYSENFFHKGLSILPQVKIGIYRVDFQVETCKIIIEIDGKNYHNNFNKDISTSRTNKDYERQLYLQQIGYHIIRFTGSQIYNNVHKCIKTLKEFSLSLEFRGRISVHETEV